MNTPEFTRELSPRVVPPDPLASAVGRSLDAMVQRPTAGVEPGQNLPVAGGSGSPPNGEPPVARRQVPPIATVGLLVQFDLKKEERFSGFLPQRFLDLGKEKISDASSVFFGPIILS